MSVAVITRSIAPALIWSIGRGMQGLATMRYGMGAGEEWNDGIMAGEPNPGGRAGSTQFGASHTACMAPEYLPGRPVLRSHNGEGRCCGRPVQRR